MFNKQLEKIKTSYFKGSQNNKKKIENLVVFLIITIITFIAINKIWNGSVGAGVPDDSKEKNEDTINKKLAYETDTTTSENSLQTNLENILTKIAGVGKVNVLITYSESSEIVPLYDETTSETSTEETDTSGGKRLTTDVNTQKQAILEENSSGQKGIITQKIVSPKIEGAIITAEGGGNAGVKEQIINAVEAATGLATHKIQVFKMN